MHQDFEDTNLMVVTHQNGLTVAGGDRPPRSKCATLGANFNVTKNRLAKIALKGTQFEALNDTFTGPTAIAMSEGPGGRSEESRWSSRKRTKS